MESICIICKKNVENPTKLTEKGAKSINAASVQRGIDDITAVAGSAFHDKCRTRHVDKKGISILKRQNAASSSTQPESIAQSKRQRLPIEERHGVCLFCTENVDFILGDGSKVETHNFATSILECCQSRADEWSYTVQGKINFYDGDLPAHDCVYHRSCSVNFRNGKNIPRKYKSSPGAEKSSGRPENEVRYNAFLEACDVLKEDDDEDQISVSDLVKVMEEKLTGTGLDAYSQIYMKKKVVELFGGDIEVSGASGKGDILTYRPKASSILRDYYNKPKDTDVELQKIRLLQAAAAIIKNDIKESIPSKGENYPTADSLSRSNSIRYVPSTLRLLLSQMFSGKETELKVAAVGQSIIQAVRPRAVIAPMQLGLSFLLQQHYRSRYLIDTLHKIGFCSSYKEALRFERCAAALNGCDLETLLTPNSKLKCSADNVDDLTRTLDGKNTFHGMGIIAIVSNGSFSEKLIIRREVPDEEILRKSEVCSWRFPNKTLPTTTWMYSGWFLGKLRNLYQIGTAVWRQSITLKKNHHHQRIRL